MEVTLVCLMFDIVKETLGTVYLSLRNTSSSSSRSFDVDVYIYIL